MTQREAACLETYIISSHSPETNIKYYWTPDQSAEHSEEARLHHSLLMNGRSQPRSGVDKAAKSRTNKNKFNLLLNGEVVNTFDSKSSVEISNWILENYGVAASPSALWATIKERKGSNYNGFKLVKISESEELSPRTLLLRSIVGKSVMVKDMDENVRFFVSSASAAEALNINEGDFASSSRGDYQQALNFNSRYLTEIEVIQNIEKWPVYHKVFINKREYKFLNISRFCDRHNLVKGTVHKLLSGSQEYCITKGKKVAGVTIWNYESFEIFNLGILDDLKTPTQRNAKYKSQHSGIYWQKNKQQWNIRVTLEGHDVNIGYTKSEIVAKEVSQYIFSNKSKPNLVEEARSLLKRLKRQTNERVRNDEHLRFIGSGRELLINAARIGQEILDKTTELPSGKRNREEWYIKNYGIAARVGQRYSQVARERVKRPGDFEDSQTIKEFLSRKTLSALHHTKK